MLSDVLKNSVYDEYLIEEEKSTINTELLECLRDEPPSFLEFAHQNMYRNHPLGKPILGKRVNINNVTRDMVVGYHDINYTGENFSFCIHNNLEN